MDSSKDACMDITTILEGVTQLTGVGLAGLVLVVGYLLGKMVVSLGRNHLEHMQKSYDALAGSIDRSATAQETQAELTRAQTEVLKTNTRTLEALRISIDTAIQKNSPNQG